ncbi:hydroxysqualene dehydroxylase HpnE [Sideroxydans lithotrophicus]|uniref:Squalene-associated FAD-dependent desaturase n=1 Tax=Sideroxydans lithotrophicus (strain ES-1) TaxID=580332 RepID=D5CRT6_SIDLE|nr:hydroxysqualene dehydroxylase HpnE [Sideroxydans lithotrophicus]ADE11672.1 squalene-associated FAD-dependent desaturase [Sideroxydans lithotrophicus ES-1]
MAQELKVGIIGGGYAGMAAAVELADRGIPVTVFESAKQLGGRARGVRTPHPVLHDKKRFPPSIQLSPEGGKGNRPLPGDTLILDNGQHLLLGCYRETLRLIEKVGGDISQDFMRLPLQLDLHGQFSLKAPRLPAPFHLLAGLLQAQGLTWHERMKAVRFMLALRGMGFRLSSDMTVSALLERYGQDADLTFKLWEPLCIAALNTPIHKASAQVLLNVLRDSLNRSRADSDMLLPRLDFTALFPQRAAAYVEQRGGMICLSCGIDSIDYRTGNLELAVAGTTHTFSHVICATSPFAAAKLLRPVPALESTVHMIDKLEHQPIYTIYLQYPEHIMLSHAMIGLHQRFCQWLFDKGQIAGQHGLIAAVISAEGIHQELSQEELAQKAITELREEFAIDAAPQWFKVIAEKRATFCCVPDLPRPAQQTALPNLLLAGDYTAGDYPATLEGAVLSGLQCARLLAKTTPT